MLGNPFNAVFALQVLPDAEIGAYRRGKWHLRTKIRPRILVSTIFHYENTLLRESNDEMDDV